MNTRIRRGTYSERAPFNWRLRGQLHELITAAAVEASTTTTAFVIDAVAKTASRPVSNTHKQRFERVSLDGALVSVTLRLDNAFLVRVQAAAKGMGWSTNKYITYAAWLAVQT